MQQRVYSTLMFASSRTAKTLVRHLSNLHSTLPIFQSRSIDRNHYISLLQHPQPQLPRHSVSVRKLNTSSRCVTMVLERIRDLPGVFMKDPEAVIEKLEKIRDGGHDNLQIVTDFDQTLTAYFMPDGTRVSSSHGLIERSKFLVPDLAARLNKLFTTYYPIEVDQNVTYEDKLAHMEYWWNKTNEAFIEAKFDRKHIPEIVANGSSRFRDGFDSFLQKTKELDVPCCILSAGLADVIRGVLESHLNGGLAKYPNVHIISNLMEFDDNGICIGFIGEVIHVLNKKEVTIAGTEFGKQALKRHNLILMGDSLGDVQMSDGIEHSNIIKIGYLNIKEERKEKFLEEFDIVILNDGDMTVPNYVLELASSGWRTSKA
ncbi:hypothetical protein SARC_02064 [Sphaeroforma arctica JP610]|uniref:5'-nucleotidase n=1 Tax=Sphaeroforma arctica JP610 TaxID=667725 RepID=A0A0L0G9T3_9EUKA|nr:hypothetical protein SARC_02064 [Sphaeroforma arctica JP610]KNC85760.1 hypothetical protein SARC_02064 [Sphaeroforma arctica JP610]|eukprot:XP_014159662.1 hypothetical protein SARC_02064 [Sphaeroforma arctica JP610]